VVAAQITAERDEATNQKEANRLGWMDPQKAPFTRDELRRALAKMQ
jgi:hypothetical protein